MCEHVDILALINVAPQKANKTNHLHAFLQYEQYPPLIPQSSSQHPPPNQRDHIHPMECIMFSASWLQSRVYQEACNTQLHHFEVLACAHSLQTQGMLKFSVPMWPMSGPMDGVIHCVACWACDEMKRKGERPSIINLSAKMLQYHTKGNNWQIVLELDHDKPHYMKHINKPWTHVI